MDTQETVDFILMIKNVIEEVEKRAINEKLQSAYNRINNIKIDYDDVKEYSEKDWLVYKEGFEMCKTWTKEIITDINNKK